MSTELVTQVQQEVAESKEALAVEYQIVRALADGREALWRLAEALYAFDEIRGWLRLGYDTLGEWLADADVTMSRNYYNRLVRVWRDLVIERQVDPELLRPIHLSKVIVVQAQIAAGRVRVDKALGDAQALGEADLREKYCGAVSNAVPEDSDIQNTGTGDGAVSNAGTEDDPASDAGDPDTTPSTDIGHGQGDPAEPTIEELALVDAEPTPWRAALEAALEAAIQTGEANPRLGRPGDVPNGHEMLGEFLAWGLLHGVYHDPDIAHAESVMERESQAA
ncbi:MAG TPA: hypothetical protein VIJ66_03540 [Solirubrobacteraceae bacterium]